MEANLFISMKMRLAELSQQEQWNECITMIQTMLSLSYLDKESKITYNRKLLIYKELAKGN